MCTRPGFSAYPHAQRDASRGEGKVAVRILRAEEVTRRTGLSRTSIWRLERRGEFPARRRLGPNAVGWIEKEVTQWIESRPRAAVDEGDAS